jgi:hypothetical protein
VPFGDGKDELYFSVYARRGNNMSVGKRLTDDDAVVITLVLTGEVADEVVNLSSLLSHLRIYSLCLRDLLISNSILRLL